MNDRPSPVGADPEIAVTNDLHLPDGEGRGQILRVHDDVVIPERVIFPKSHRETLTVGGVDEKRFFREKEKTQRHRAAEQIQTDASTSWAA